TATVSASAPGSGTPSGTVNFTDGGTTIAGCGGQGLSGGQATCVVSYAATGSHTVAAVYSSDANFTASTSSNLTQTVNKAATSTVAVASVNLSLHGALPIYTATVSASAPGSGTPSGTVNFTDGGSTITGCGAKTLSSGQATCSTSYAAT